MSADPTWALLERLAFDPELRERFAEDREAVLEGLPPEVQGWFRAVDLGGLTRDAELRARYLLSALCRSYPLSAAALGAAPGGAARLRAFLGSPALFGPLGERSQAFGVHLGRLLELNPMDAPASVLALLGAVLALERGLVDNAVALRAAAELGQAPGAPQAPSAAQLRRGRVGLPPYLVAVELPQPSELVRAALDGVGPEDAWHRVSSGLLSWDRVLAVGRAEEQPVTVLCRGYAAGLSAERAGAGGVAPLVDVRHLRVELLGRQSALLQLLAQNPRLDELPGPRQALLRRLVEAGVAQARG